MLQVIITTPPLILQRNIPAALHKPINYQNIMSQRTLTFVSSQSIAQFKSEKMIDILPVKKNPTTGKLFLSFAGNTGAVALSYDSNKPKLISLVRDAEGVEFYMLHNEGTGAETVETL